MKGDYKEAQAAIKDLKAGDIRGLEPAMRFLKDDVQEFRSGYLKEYLWRYLSRVSFTERQKERFLQIGRKYLERRMTREFWQMCRFIGQIADAEFAEQVENLAASAHDEGVRQRATLLKAYLKGIEAGEIERQKFNRIVRYGSRQKVTSDEA